MALAKDRNTQDSNNILLPVCSYYDVAFDGSETNGVKCGSSSAIGFYGTDVYQKMVMEGGSVMVGGAGASSNSSGNSQSVLEFHGGGDDWTYSSGSLLCFEQAEKNRSRFVEQEDHELSDWADCVDINNAKWSHHIGYKDGVDPRLSEKANSFDTSNGYGGVEGRCLINKRPHLGGEVEASKKQCAGASTNRKAKAKPSPAKDPQSVAAKNRRERISERLKILQDLVPNGTKVDLVTMLEKAISYVKFLQLQVKVLATDEFWPAAGGKAPEVAQVKEAIDAILSSCKDRSSSSK